MTTDQQIFEKLEQLIELNDIYELDTACSKAYSVSRKNAEFTSFDFCRTSEQRHCDFITVHDSQSPLWTINGNVISKYELIGIVEDAYDYWTKYVEDNYCEDSKLKYDDCDCYECQTRKEDVHNDFMYDTMSEAV